MASPSTSTLRSGTVSRFSGGGALEKVSTRLGACCCCCWIGVTRSPPNQPPPPPLLRGWGRDHPPKLKNCADAGPAIPTNSATATESAISGPVSVKIRKKDLGFCMRMVRKWGSGGHYTSGFGRQAGIFDHRNPAHWPEITVHEAAAVGRRRQIRPRESRSKPETRAAPRASARQTGHPGPPDRTRAAPEAA